jgi:membrane fusion protein, multidrug efflux system
MNKRLLLAAVLVAGLLLGAVLFKQRAAPSPGAAPPAPAASSAVALVLTGADVVRVTESTLQTELAVSGNLSALQTAWIKARVAGVLMQLSVREGDSVSAGQVIGQIDPSEYTLRLQQAEQQAQAARAQLDQAERALANNQALVTQGFISATALDSAVSNAASARATLLAARAASDLARKSLNDAQLVVPIGGLVSQRLAQAGERLALDARVVEIVDLSRLTLDAPIAAQDAGQLRVGALARLRVDGLAQPVDARLARINPSASAGSRTISAYFDVAGQPGLRQGLFAQGSLLTGQVNALLVPNEAIRLDLPQPSLILAEAGRARRITVQLGAAGRSDGVAVTAVTAATGTLSAGSLVLSARTGPVADGTPLRLPEPAPAPAAASQP